MQYLIKVPEVSPNWKTIRNKSIDIFEVQQSPKHSHYRNHKLYDVFAQHSLTAKATAFKTKSTDSVIEEKAWKYGCQVRVFNSFQQAHDAKIKLLQDVQNEFYKHLEGMIAAISTGIHPTALVKRD